MEVLKPIAQKLSIKDTILENTLTEEAQNELNKIKRIEKWKIEKTYRVNKYIFNFQNFWTKSTYRSDMYNSKITTEEADED